MTKDKSDNKTESINEDQLIEIIIDDCGEFIFLKSFFTILILVLAKSKKMK